MKILQLVTPHPPPPKLTSKSPSKAHTPSPPRALLAASSPGGPLRRSVSLPGSPVSSKESGSKNDSSGWIRVGTKSSPENSVKSKSVSARSKSASSRPTKPLTSSQLDSEENLISAAQKIIRNRLSIADGGLPPFSNAAERKKYRKLQRQTILSLCDDEEGAASIASGFSVTNKFDPIAFGTVEAVLPRQASTFLEA